MNPKERFLTQVIDYLESPESKLFLVSTESEQIKILHEIKSSKKTK